MNMKLTLQRVTIINSVKNIKTAFLFKKEIFYNKKKRQKTNNQIINYFIFFCFFKKSNLFVFLNM